MKDLNKKVRVRFAPSPTGNLTIGGVRTALYNYLFAKKMGGDFILRIEDTDSKRSVDGSTDYVIESLKWLGIEPNEGFGFGDGKYGPYIQSERNHIYKPIIDKLINDGNAYYAFDTDIDIEKYKLNKDFKYNLYTRHNLNNSLNMSKDKLDDLLKNNVPYVIRAKIPKDRDIIIDDVVRGKVVFSSNVLDDKILIKSDGIPTYHFAATVDDYLMDITHVFRGDEWLPSAPLHILIHEWIGNINPPIYAHLSVILRPDGKKKLSKRDGDELGICVFPINYKDDDGFIKKGYRELGYSPDALLNNLALLGWNPGNNIEFMKLNEMIDLFDITKFHKAGARFDKKKSEWLNKQHIMNLSDDDFVLLIFNNIEKPIFLGGGYNYKIYCEYIKDGITQIHALKYFYDKYKTLLDIVPLIRTKIDNFNDIALYVKPLLYGVLISCDCLDNEILFGLKKLNNDLLSLAEFSPENIENVYKNVLNNDLFLSTNKKIFMKAFRRALTNEDIGASVYHIASFIRKNETSKRLIDYIEFNEFNSNLKPIENV